MLSRASWSDWCAAVQSADGEAQQVDADYQAVTEAVLRECKVNLAHIKETITSTCWSSRRNGAVWMRCPSSCAACMPA